MFGRLDRHMTEEKLDLVKFASGQMTETGTCASQVVRCQLVDSGSLGRPLDDLPEHLRRHALAPDLS